MMFLTQRDGLAPLGWLRDEMDRLFECVTPQGDGFVAPLTLHETESAFEARIAVAGADPEKLEIGVEGNVLHVAGEREGMPDDAQRRFTAERFAGHFERALELPAAVAADEVQAHYRDGILTVTLPKAAEARPRRITVQV